jgi:hypothetical protein
LKRGAISILRILDQENHQEGYDAADGVHHQLSRIGKVKERTCDKPTDNEPARYAERPWTSADVGRLCCDLGKPMFAFFNHGLAAFPKWLGRLNWLHLPDVTENDTNGA